jgi:hypothetical protein
MTSEPVSTTNIDEAIHLWRTRGWVLMDGLVPTADIDDAAEDLWHMFPTPEDFHSGDPEAMARFEDLSTDVVQVPKNDLSDGRAIRARQFLGHRMMPYSGSGKLNRMTVHPNVVDFAKRAMGDDDLRIYQARVWGKYTGVTNYEQPFHMDGNHNVVPDRMEMGWWNLEGFLYLSDVDEGVAPTQVYGTGPMPNADAGVPAAGVRGSYLAYRPDVWHRGVDLTREGGSRFIMNIAFKHAGHDWIGYDNMQPRAITALWCKFAASCTPEELALFGAPLPGHDYWTPELVDALEERYIGINATPWRDALTPR